jgi:hypothetical protein
MIETSLTKRDGVVLFEWPNLVKTFKKSQCVALVFKQIYFKIIYNASIVAYYKVALFAERSD